MRVGLDTFSIRELDLSPLQTLDWIAEHGLEGAQFGAILNSDAGALKEIRARGNELDLYVEMSMPNCNPHQVRTPLDEYRQELEAQVRKGAELGWHDLHTALGGGNERYLDGVPWTAQLDDTAQFLRSLAPVLREHRSRICIETHGDVTTFELIRLIEDVGPDIAGICLDTANLFCQCEDPVRAARRAAPYVHLTHIKDAMMVLTPTGYRRQTLEPGRGMIDWQTLLPILAQHSPNLPLSIEDHKWLFDFHVFDPHWLRLHPDLTLEEYGAVLQIAWRSTQRVAEGSLPDLETYEAIPYLDELEPRLTRGCEYLKGLVRKLGLEDREAPGRNYQSLSMTAS
ncbi:MAG: sugar phosphate isomerase/epimerase family protein [Planctomycetota bacterium]|jgi:sugar phosphate isomerase/epimerase